MLHGRMAAAVIVTTVGTTREAAVPEVDTTAGAGTRGTDATIGHAGPIATIAAALRIGAIRIGQPGRAGTHGTTTGGPDALTIVIVRGGLRIGVGRRVLTIVIVRGGSTTVIGRRVLTIVIVRGGSTTVIGR